MRQLPPWCRDVVLLGPDAPIPIDRPFTSGRARQEGVGPELLRRLVDEGLLRRMTRGVLVASQVPDSLRLRAEAVRLILPAHAVVVDRTAAWLHGLDVLPRSAIHEMPRLDIDSRAASRMRRHGVAGGIRGLTGRDVMEIDDLAVTTPLRTACDLGRALWRFDAIGALDGFLRLGVDREELLAETDRFKGYRGVVQLRELAPLADARAESMPEGALRLHWLDAGLPPPEPQVWVCDEVGAPTYRIDLGSREVRYGAEYDGEEFHGPDQAEHDRRRRAWLDRERGWLIDVFVKDHVYGSDSGTALMLRSGFRRARARLGQHETTYVDLRRS